MNFEGLLTLFLSPIIFGFRGESRDDVERGPPTSAKTKAASKGKQISPCLMARMDAGPHLYKPWEGLGGTGVCVIPSQERGDICQGRSAFTVAGLLRCGIHNLPAPEAGREVRSGHVALVPAVIVPGERRARADVSGGGGATRAHEKPKNWRGRSYQMESLVRLRSTRPFSSTMMSDFRLPSLSWAEK